MKKFISANEDIASSVNTLEDLADYINAHDDWCTCVQDIIEYNGWKDNTDTEYGICATDYAVIELDSKGKAFIEYKSDVTDIEFDHKTSFLSYRVNGIPFWVQGEFNYDKDSETFRHTHYCRDSEETDVVIEFK